MKNIKHFCLVCFSIFVMVSCAAHSNNIPSTPNDTLTVIERIRASVILLTVSPNTTLEENPKENAMCSGAVIESQYIITNFHCIYKQKYIKAYFWDKDDWNEYDIEVIGEDPLADLALLKILNKEKVVPHLNFFKGEITIGEEVYAMGHPMGMAWTLTKGIISSNDRYARHPYVKAIQTDTAINQGNSGGPLLNMKGEIIGINAMIMSRVKENAGIGIAIRADTVEHSYKTMLSEGKVDRPAIGVMIAPLLREAQRKKIANGQPEIKLEDIPNTFGLMVLPTENMPEGLLVGDAIVGVNGSPINNGIDLADILSKLNIGDIVTLTIIRNKRFKTLKVPLRLFVVPVDKLYNKGNP